MMKVRKYTNEKKGVGFLGEAAYTTSKGMYTH